MSWDRDEHKNSKLSNSLMPLFRLKARFSAVRFEFVPLGVADHKTPPGQELCDSCEHLRDTMPNHWNIYAEENDECECSNEDMSWSERVMLEEFRISYTAVFADILSNYNAVWTKDLLNSNITIKYFIAKDTQRVTFRILCKESLCHGVRDTRLRGTCWKDGASSSWHVKPIWTSYWCTKRSKRRSSMATRSRTPYCTGSVYHGLAQSRPPNGAVGGTIAMNEGRTNST